MKTLWLIAARSGSTGIPDKNVKLLAGHPLLAYRVAAAREIAARPDVWISTDSSRYAEIAATYGATVPFLRPAELATDAASSVDVVVHALDVAEAQGLRYEAVALLEPTAPFVRSSTLSAALAQLSATPAADAIVATRTVRPSTFYVQPAGPYLDVLGERLGAGILRRQDERAEITPSGGFYIARTESVRRRGTFYSGATLAYPVGLGEDLEIDEPIDWDWAEFLVERGKATLPQVLGQLA